MTENEKLESLKQQVLQDLALKKEGQDDFMAGVIQEAKDVLYEINKLLEED